MQKPVGTDGGAGGSPAAKAAVQAGAAVNVLLRQVVEGMPKGGRQELRVIIAGIEPGGRTPRHSHRFPVTVYVLEGTFTLELEGYEPITAAAGEALIEPPHTKMVGFNRGAEPLKLAIFYVSDPDTPFADVTP